MIVVVFLAFAAARVGAVSPDEVAALAKRISGPLKAARYMEQQCELVEVPKWEAIPTQRCRYSVRDRATGTVKTGLVVMANPDAERLATWILSACETIRPSQSRDRCSKKLFAQVLQQSGGQFPVAGVVYEDIIPQDGVFEAYGFKNGVTSQLRGFQHRRTTPLSAVELDAALSAEAVATISAAAYARVIGVTRQQFKAANPATDVSGLLWSEVVASEHQKAMKGTSNALFNAWLAGQDP